MSKTKGILIGCGGLSAVGIFIAAILGFFVYRNLYPAPTKELVPDTAGKFKLDKFDYSAGNIWGTTASFSSYYVLADDASRKINYRVQELRSVEEARNIVENFPCSKVNPREGLREILKDKSGKEIGRYTFCYKDQLGDKNIGSVIFSNGKRWGSLHSQTDKNSPPITFSEMNNFLAGLPYNSEIDFSKLETTETTTSVPLKSNPEKSNGTVLSGFDLDKQHRKSKESVSQYNGKEIVVRGYVYTAPIAPTENGAGLVRLGEKDVSIKETFIGTACWFEKEEAANFAGIKEQYIIVKGTFDGKYLTELRYCKLISKE